MVLDAERSLSEADLLLVIVDGMSSYSNLGLHPRLLRLLALHPTLPALLVINKVDATSCSLLTQDTNKLNIFK